MLAIVCAVLALAGCSLLSIVDGGERLSVMMLDSRAKPLAYAMVTDNVPDGITLSFGHVTGYLPPHDVRVPEDVEFSWQFKGEDAIHTKRLRLRSQIPRNVLSKVSGISANKYFLGLTFEIERDGPAVEWRLVKLLGKNGPFEYPATGVIK